MAKFLHLGAEARLTLENKKVVKKRIKKGYRLAQIDTELRTTRTSREASLMKAAQRAKVLVPRILKTDKENSVLEMDFIDGKRVDTVLSAQIAKKLGKEVAQLHSAGIIHGDLTTSNILVKGKELYFIDFGLGEFSNSIEKKAVDLRVLKEAIRANHPKQADAYIKEILNAYKSSAERGAEILKRLEQVDLRGRYKER